MCTGSSSVLEPDHAVGPPICDGKWNDAGCAALCSSKRGLGQGREAVWVVMSAVLQAVSGEQQYLTCDVPYETWYQQDGWCK